MTRAIVLASAALLLAAPAAAQTNDAPKELWSEYPLVQEAERASTPQEIGPFLPPTDPAPAIQAGDSVNWTPWALAASLGLVAVVVGLRVARTNAAPSVVEPFPLREPTGRKRRGGSRSLLGQYAPTRSPQSKDGLVENPPRSIVLRTGFVRARYLVVADRWADGLETVGGSRSFWRLGPAAVRERLAEDAWDELVADLRAQGWEPNPQRRSEFYVLLQRTEPESVRL